MLYFCSCYFSPFALLSLPSHTRGGVAAARPRLEIRSQSRMHACQSHVISRVLPCTSVRLLGSVTQYAARTAHRASRISAPAQQRTTHASKARTARSVGESPTQLRAFSLLCAVYIPAAHQPHHDAVLVASHADCHDYTSRCLLIASSLHRALLLPFGSCPKVLALITSVTRLPRLDAVHIEFFASAVAPAAT